MACHLFAGGEPHPGQRFHPCDQPVEHRNAQRAAGLEEKASELTGQLKGRLSAAEDQVRNALLDEQGREFEVEAGDLEDGIEFHFGGRKLEIPESELLPQLVKIARTDANAEVRREALRAIARLRSEASTDALISIYDGSKDVKTKDWIIRGLASNGSKKAAQKLIAIAQSDSDPQMRLQALRRLGDLAGSSHPEIFPAPGVGTRVRPPKPPRPPKAPALLPQAPPAPAEPPKPQEPAK